MRIVDSGTSSANGFGVKLLSNTPGVSAFLRSNPFIFRRNDVFNAAVFVDGDQSLDDETIRKIYKDHFHPGISRIIITHRLNEDHHPTPSVIPAELSDEIEIHDVQDVFGKAAESIWAERGNERFIGSDCPRMRSTSP